ncbi:MAG TPA: 5'/3'-nucleotidase SurE [Acidimicrobiales bacterium]|jgi:5'-nucleotidase|nr:5'/3'-nucleotidase SurE [Acidimicrobiales bacterium]
MRVLVTNDDGVHADGILPLAVALVARGHDVVVAAPLDDMSGSAAALGPGHSSGVRVETVVLPELGEAVPVFGVDGPPGMCVMAAHLEAFGPRPDTIASGINHGSNTGRSVLFSGTVGAALAAANFGLKGVAVSVKASDPWRFDTAAEIGAAAVDWIEGSPNGTVLNINVPALDLDEIKGVRVGRLAPFGVVRTVLEGRDHDRLHLVLRDTDEELAEDTDTMLVTNGYVSVNALVGPRVVDAGDAPQALEAVLFRAR